MQRLPRGVFEAFTEHVDEEHAHPQTVSANHLWQWLAGEGVRGVIAQSVAKQPWHLPPSSSFSCSENYLRSSGRPRWRPGDYILLTQILVAEHRDLGINFAQRPTRMSLPPQKQARAFSCKGSTSLGLSAVLRMKLPIRSRGTSGLCQILKTGQYVGRP